MYTAFFQLANKPFRMTPDPAFLYLTPSHREALAGITYAILDRKGFLVLSGMAGTGKTTVLTSVLGSLPQSKVRTSVILNPTLTPSEFLEMAMIDFGILDIPESKAQRLWKLQAFLMKARQADQICALIVDEAHKLNPELLEEVRLLGNFEHADEKLLQILLIGQSELDEVLSRKELWQFTQRISVRLSIPPLSPAATGEYIAHRWAKAGGSAPHPFSPQAVARIALLSAGIPRIINCVCDNALTLAFADSARRVEVEHINSVAIDLHLTEPLAEKPAPAILAPAPPAAKALPETFPVRMKTLERYAPSPSKSSLFARWAERLGLA
jgi:general secretion pathway protein A